MREEHGGASHHKQVVHCILGKADLLAIPGCPGHLRLASCAEPVL